MGLWDYAIGMIKVDGLEPTEEFKEDVLGGQSIEYSDPFDIATDIRHISQMVLIFLRKNI